MRALNRAQPVGHALVLRASHSCFDVVDDRVGIFGPRVVAGDDSAVGVPFGDLTHERTLALVAVAAASEDHDQLSAGEGARRLQGTLERIRRVRVVAEHRRVRRDMISSLPATCGTVPRRSRYYRRRLSERDCGCSGGQRVLDVDVADQGQRDIGGAARRHEPSTHFLRSVNRTSSAECPQMLALRT